ncbi:hypothetical protein BKA61DRAFT_58351 [Leptodontidium sp. MPI-SDFR-AT-0119]|nr:hypothetical protein BKA61DRAFT_58351 [Leptodontidium sp. MPI-SDFR-AT-0119]
MQTSMTSTALVEPLSSKIRAVVFPPPQWQNPELSIGEEYLPLGHYRCWGVAGAARADTQDLLVEVKTLLNKKSKVVNKGQQKIPIISLRLYMIGEAEANSNPTFLFSCACETPRRRAIKLVRTSKILARYPPGIRLAESTVPPLRKPLPPMSSSLPQVITTGSASAIGLQAYLVDIPKGGCAKLVDLRAEGPSFFRRTTIGGIWIDNTYYGMTVAHALEPIPHLQAYNAEVNQFRFEEGFDSEEIEDDYDDMITNERAIELTSQASISSRTTSGSESGGGPKSR